MHIVLHFRTAALSSSSSVFHRSINISQLTSKSLYSMIPLSSSSNRLTKRKGATRHRPFSSSSGAARQGQKVYAVARGRQVGLFNDWKTCEQQVSKFPGALFKSFNSREEAREWIDKNTNGGSRQQQQQQSGGKSDTPEIVETICIPRAKITFPRTFPRLSGVELEKVQQVYTDGSCFGNGKQRGAVAAGVGVFFGPDDPRNISEPLRFPGPLTNQRAEIAAAIRALQILREEEDNDKGVLTGRGNCRHVEIITDSKYLIMAMQSWIYDWERNDWKNSRGQDVMNMDLFSMLIDLVQERYDNRGRSCVKWTHIAGHEGMYGNTEADALAVAGSQQQLQEKNDSKNEIA